MSTPGLLYLGRQGGSKLELPGPSCQSLDERADTQNLVTALTRGGQGHGRLFKPHIIVSGWSKQSQPCLSSLQPREKHLMVVGALEAAPGGKTGFLGLHPRAIQLQYLLEEGVPEALT